MSRIVLKGGDAGVRVLPIALQCEALLAINVCFSVWQQGLSETDFVITSISDGKHGYKSLHRFGYAFDLRTKNIHDSISKNAVVEDFKNCLGPNYDVILEGFGEDWEHIHVEYDPK